MGESWAHVSEIGQAKEHEQEVAASEAANALQSAELKAQQKAVEDKQRELDELQASLWTKVCVRCSRK